MNKYFQVKRVKPLTLLIFHFLILVGCQSKSESSIGTERDKVVELKIESVNFYISTIHRIECDYFTSFFRDEINTYSIKDSIILSRFENALTKLKVDTNRYMPDVRGRIFIVYSSQNIDTMCLSGLGIVFNGTAMKYDSTFRSFINQKDTNIDFE